jgi:DHA1 family tetracycline resistance protein-like MFS transporter
LIRRLLPILGITFVDILGFSLLIPLLPYYVTHFGASALVVGILFSTFSFCQLLAGPIWGYVSDRIGRKAVLIISQVGATIGWTMLAFAPSVGFVFLARIVEGISGGNIGVTQAYVADLVEPRQRAKAFGYIGATFAAAMAFGPLMGGLIFGATHSYAIPLLAAAALQLLTLLLTIVKLPESRSKSEEPAVVGFGEIARTFSNPAISPILWQKLALSLALYGWFSVIALYLARQLGFSLTQTDYFYSAFAVVNVLSNTGGVGRASDKLGDRRMAMLGIFCLVAAFALVPFVHAIWTMVVVMILFSVGMSFANTGLTALISAASDDAKQGTVLGVTSSLDSVSGIVAPPISTALLGKLGSPWAAAASLGFAAISFSLGLRGAKASPSSAVVRHGSP